MARPEEKARSMLNKWTRMKEEMKEDSGLLSSSSSSLVTRRKRPYLASLCPHVSDAEQFRNQIIHEISTKLTKIQNPGLNEHAIRDLNDDINKLFREKHHWNKRIKELGGPDYNRLERLDAADGEGSSIGGPEYRYYGRAKELPGVKESFAQQSATIVKKKRGNVYQYITPEYYGLREEEDDGTLLQSEKKASENRRQALVHHRQQFMKSHMNEESDDEDLYTDWIGGGSAVSSTSTSNLIHTQGLLNQILLEHKKKMLLDSLDI